VSHALLPLSDADYRTLSGLLVAETGVYVFGLAAALPRLARAGLCSRDGLLTTAGRAAHAAEKTRRDAAPVPDPSRALSRPIQDRPYLIAS
jgi:hypothetical protein